MPAVAQMVSSGAIDIGNLRGTHGLVNSVGQGYSFAGPVTSPGMQQRYVPAQVALPISNYYGADPEKGTVPSSGTISLNNFYGTRPSARFYCGYETSTEAPNAKRYGYGDAYSQVVDAQQNNRLYAEGSRFIQPERGVTNAQLGSISHRSLIDAGTDNVWITGVQVQRMQGDSGPTWLVVFLETSRGNGFNLTYLNANFTNLVLRFGTTTFTIPFNTKNTGSTVYPMDSLYMYANEFGTMYIVPPFYSWYGASSGTSTQMIIHTTLWNAFVNAYNTGTPGYVYFT